MSADGEPKPTPIWDQWGMKPTKMMMSKGVYRDLVVWGLMQDGWTEESAEAEADRRVEIIESEGSGVC